MSAIFGACSLSGSALDPGLLDALGRAFLHRPSDHTGAYQKPSLVLGVRALSGVDLHPLDEPALYVDRETTIVCALDGRLDYRADLCARLSLPDVKGKRDEALIVAAYRRFGVAFCDKLEGDFACALWDESARRFVLLRDPLGLRSLYLTRVGQTLLFASQARALFAHPKVSRRANPQRLAAYLARDFPDTSSTFFADIERLPPGHVLIAEAGRERVQAFHHFERTEPLLLESSGAYSERFRDTFMAAVSERTRGARDVGVMLSGGLDSAGVLGALRRLSPERVWPCFSARFPDFPEVDEGSWLALHEGSIERNEARADQMGPLDAVDRLHDTLDEPFHAPNLFIYDALAALAKARGVQVVLDGLDGDTVVDHGLCFLNELLHRGRVRRLGREMRALKRRAGLGITGLLRAAVLSPDLERLEHARFAFTGNLKRLALVTQDFAQKSGYLERARRQAKASLTEPRDFRSLHLRAVTSNLLPFYFEIHDKLAASYGIDHRHPYFDRRLVEFCLSLPAEQRLFDGWDRAIQRRAFKGMCPEPIRLRQSKSVWTPNFQRQLLVFNAEAIRATLALSPHPLEGIADLATVRALGRDLRPGSSPHAVIALWAAVTLTRWMVCNNVTV